MRAKTVEKSASKKKTNWALPNQKVTHDELSITKIRATRKVKV